MIEHSSILLPSGSNSVVHQSVSILVNGNVFNTGDPDEIRLEVCFNNLLKKGYSLDAANLFANSHKDSTINQYQSGWKLWLSYLISHSIPTHKVTSITLCNFLAFQGVQIHRSLSTVKNYFYVFCKPFNFFIMLISHPRMKLMLYSMACTIESLLPLKKTLLLNGRCRLFSSSFRVLLFEPSSSSL